MSASGTRSARSRRCRVILVRHGAEAAATASQITAMLSAEPIVARSMFEAIGAAAASRAGEPIAAILLPEALARSPHEHAVEALRKVEPSVRVVAFAIAPASGPQPGSGIDAWLALPVRAEDLRRALDDDELMAKDADAASALADAPPVVQPQTSRDNAAIIELFESLGGSASPAHLHCNSTEVHNPEIVAAAGAVSAAAASVAPPPSPAPSLPSTSVETSAAEVRPQPAALSRNETIGDTDLIEALINHKEGVTPLALQLIARHAGWEQVRLDAASVEVGNGAAIRLGHQHFGFLSAEGATPEALRPWADWLARWLALEDEHRRFRHEAHLDDLTGAWNRRFFEAFLSETLAEARPDRRPVTVMVFDIDNFKVYNDQFGHAAGDDILREIVRLLKSIVRQGDIVCRIGGDEFVVVFADREAPRTPGSKHPESAESITRRFQEAVCSMRFPKLGGEAPGTLSVSAGLATYPWDGQDAPSLLRHADERALESKRRGKNTVTLGRPLVE